MFPFTYPFATSIANPSFEAGLEGWGTSFTSDGSIPTDPLTYLVPDDRGYGTCNFSARTEAAPGGGRRARMDSSGFSGGSYHLFTVFRLTAPTKLAFDYAWSLSCTGGMYANCGLFVWSSYALVYNLLKTTNLIGTNETNSGGVTHAEVTLQPDEVLFLGAGAGGGVRLKNSFAGYYGVGGTHSATFWLDNLTLTPV